MRFEDIKHEIGDQLMNGMLFEKAKEYAEEYIRNLGRGRVSPDEAAISALGAFDEPLPAEPSDPEEMLDALHEIGARATVAQSGGRYFGFVNGANFPVAIAARWMGDAWDQNSALYVMSPIAAKLEEVCEKWVVQLLGLPPETAAGFVTGSSAATTCALAAARDELIKRQGWDIHENGLFGAPPLRVVLGAQAHSSVIKALSILGIGKSQLHWAEVDGAGRIIPEKLPTIDENTLLIIQAGNVNGGAFDPMGPLCEVAQRAGAWVHVDGAFGLWAAASETKRALIKGFERADSWSADAHKTLNVPYDSGIVLVRDRSALVRAMQATGSYIQYSENRDAMLYTMEMSRRARSIELWATLKYLGTSGISAMVDELCENARYFAKRLSECGFFIENDVVFNQVLVRCETDEETTETLKRIQLGGVCWCGGAVWNGRSVIRLSVSSWRTGHEDVETCVAEFVRARDASR